MKESAVENYLVQRVKALGGEVRKVAWIGRRGAPDRLVMLPIGPRDIPVGHWYSGPGTTIWVELKAPGKKPTSLQLREHERMREMGQRVEVIDSIEGVDELLK